MKRRTSKRQDSETNLPTKLKEEDRLRLQVKLLERNNVQLECQQKLQNAQVAFEQFLASVNRTYSIDPEKDKIDITTGVISRGTDDKE